MDPHETSTNNDPTGAGDVDEDEDVDFSAPSIPALTPLGFLRWQVVQILLDPDEHVFYLQEAVNHFRVRDRTTGKRFPKYMPKEIFPALPDEAMTAWHERLFPKGEGGGSEGEEGLHGSGQRGGSPEGIWDMRGVGERMADRHRGIKA